MLAALRSLFETETVYVAPPGKVRQRIGFRPVYAHDAVAILEPLNVFPVIGKIEASGTANAFLEAATARFEIQVLEIGASAAATLQGQNVLEAHIGQIQFAAQDDDEEALAMILDNL